MRTKKTRLRQRGLALGAAAKRTMTTNVTRKKTSRGGALGCSVAERTMRTMKMNPMKRLPDPSSVGHPHPRRRPLVVTG